MQGTREKKFMDKSEKQPETGNGKIHAESEGTLINAENYKANHLPGESD